MTIGTSSFDYSAGEALVITADVPTISQITVASPAAPYYALALELDPAMLRALSVEADLRPVDTAPVRIQPASSTASAVFSASFQ